MVVRGGALRCPNTGCGWFEGLDGLSCLDLERDLMVLLLVAEGANERLLLRAAFARVRLALNASREGQSGADALCR